MTLCKIHTISYPLEGWSLLNIGELNLALNFKGIVAKGVCSYFTFEEKANAFKTLGLIGLFELREYSFLSYTGCNEKKVRIHSDVQNFMVRTKDGHDAALRWKTPLKDDSGNSLILSIYFHDFDTDIHTEELIFRLRICLDTDHDKDKNPEVYQTKARRTSTDIYFR